MSSNLEIRRGDFAEPQIIELLRVHFQTMRATGPAESCHVMDLAALQRPDLEFWAAWEGATLLGVGGVLVLSTTNGHEGEIKSIHTTAPARGRGIGAAMLLHLIEQAKQHGMARLSLETGAGAFFHPAHVLYRRHGFVLCPPFGSYRDDPNSIFMTKLLGLPA